MRIAMLTNNYLPFVGGVPVSIERLSESLREMGHEVEVFAPSYSGAKKEPGVFRYRAFRPGLWGGIAVPDALDPGIEREFVRGRFDVIHVHHPLLMGQAALRLSRKYRTPLVFTYHTRYEQYLHYVGLSCLKDVIPAYIRYFCDKCDGVFAPTEGMRRYLEETGVKKPVAVLPTGIPGKTFRAAGQRGAMLREKLLRNASHLFLCVARLAKEKNLDFLLRSLAVYREQTSDSFRLALVGEGPQQGELFALAQKLGLEENVLFLGRVENERIAAYYAAADVFCFPSTTETQGIVSLEAMAAGTPVLAVSATGTEDIVKNGVNGFMTAEREEDFAAQLARMVEKDVLCRLGEGAKKTALSYDMPDVAARALSCYSAAVCRKLDEGEKEKWSKGRIREVFGTFC